MRVVVAEDLALLRDGLIRMLEAHGFEVVAQAGKTTIIAELTGLVRQCLLADLPDAAQACIEKLQAAAVNAADLAGLAAAVPALVSVLRYGTARKIPEAAISALTHALAVEVIAGAAQASPSARAAMRRRRVMLRSPSRPARCSAARWRRSWRRACGAAPRLSRSRATPGRSFASRRP